MRTLVLSLALLALATSPASAHPSEVDGEFRFTGSVATYSTTTTIDDEGTLLPHFFVLGNVALSYFFDEYWGISAAVRGGGALAGDAPEGIVHGLVEARYVIESMTWAPWLAIGIGALYRTRGTEAYKGNEAAAGRVDLTVHAGGGLDYRPSRDWSVGLVVRYNLTLTDDLARFVGPIEIALHASYYF